MNSSTSNFKPELKVMAVVLTVLLVCEVVLRLMEPSLSNDLRHIRSIPRIADELFEKPGTRVLFLGNSLTRCGVDESLLVEEMNIRGIGPLSVTTVYPDGSSIAVWYFTLKTFFIEAGKKPDVVVVNFAVKHLQDQHPFNVRTLGASFTKARDVPEVFAEDIKRFSDRVEFLLASYSSAFANRARVSARILDFMTPHYRNSAERVNTKLSVHAWREHQATYKRLGRFLKLASDHNVRVVLVALPIVSDYSLDPEIKSIAEDAGMFFFDAREVEGLETEFFPDGHHMGPTAAVIYTRHLATLLSEPFGLIKNAIPVSGAVSSKSVSK